MLFNSIVFALFMAVVLPLYAVAGRFRHLLLLAASYVFYMYWEPSYAFLILGSTLIDFFVAKQIEAAPTKVQKRHWLLVSILTNLGLLFTFKYWDFFHDAMADALAPAGIAYEPPRLDVLLPVGISFYTFQTLSYSIDIYRGHLKPETSFSRFALYVSFFPQLVAGPIERATRLLPQLSNLRGLAAQRTVYGLKRIGWGLVKKTVIADRLALYVDAVYGNVEEHNGATFLIATYAFAIQIYCDFSGYSDIAVGTARLFRVRLMENFERPYWASSIQDFWRRWHISLSTWLRDYLYIPLGGNRGTELATYRNLLITMLLGGLWHGASWNFVIWGAIHGVFLSLDRLLRPRIVPHLQTRAAHQLGQWFGWLLTFHVVCFAWIFFRARTLVDSATICSSLLEPWGSPWLDLPTLTTALAGVIPLLILETARENKFSPRLAWAPRFVGWVAVVFLIILFGVDGNDQFIYFQF